jgi:hypothetical protein
MRLAPRVSISAWNPAPQRDRASVAFGPGAEVLRAGSARDYPPYSLCGRPTPVACRGGRLAAGDAPTTPCWQPQRTARRSVNSLSNAVYVAWLLRSNSPDLAPDRVGEAQAQRAPLRPRLRNVGGRRRSFRRSADATSPGTGARSRACHESGRLVTAGSPSSATTIRTRSRARARAKKLCTTIGCAQPRRQHQPDSTKPAEVHRAVRVRNTTTLAARAPRS